MFTSRKFRQYTLVATLITAAMDVIASEHPGPLLSNASGVERVALVLGGGGARGAAHIGVVEVLERERIPVSCVVGTSMGALVAGAYVAGVSPEHMREKLKYADWADMFTDKADYSQLSYRTKKINKDLIAGTEIGLSKKGGVQYQSGMIAGEKIKLFFNYLVGDFQGQRQIEDSQLPLAIVATDIGTGERVVLKEGSLSRAMRASMSVPGLMAPVEIDGHKLVDGGLVDNVPVELARELCQATRVIAVNVGSKLRPADEVNSLVSVTAQMIGILTNQNVHRSLAALREDDVYLEPQLGDITATDFRRYAEAADIGKATAEAQLAKLRQLSVSQEAYAQWKQQYQDTREIVEAVNEIKVAAGELVPEEYIRQFIRQPLDAPIDRAILDQDLIRLYGTGDFQVVDYNIYREGEKSILEILPTERPWTGDSILFGFSITDEYRDGAQINLRGAYRKKWINQRGGEFFALFDIGTEPYLEVEFYQPLDLKQAYFIEPRVVLNRDDINLFEGNSKVAEYRLSSRVADLSLGKNIGLWGQARLGWRYSEVEGRSDFNPFGLSNLEADYSGVIGRVVFDSRNRLYFPSQGWRGDLTYFKEEDGLYERVSADLGVAYPWSDFVVGLYGNYTTSLSGTLPIYDAASLGGFLNLSGYAHNQVLADETIYGHVRLEKIIGRMPLGFNGDMRMGVTLETARVRDAYTLSDPDDTLNSIGIFFGGETPFGPAYVGYGNSLEGSHNIYFQIGLYDRFKF